MKFNIYIPLLLSVLLLTSSCITEGEELCPTGDVRLHLYAEKFQNRSQNPLDAKEEKFCDRVSHLRYFLYKGDILSQEGIVSEFNDKDINCYSLDFDNLDYGEYQVLLVCNSSKKALLGDAKKAEDLYLAYPGSTETEDFFTAFFSFNVNSEEKKEYDIGLLRAQGIIRYSFVNMPSDVTKMQIVMENVAGEKWITGDYKNIYRNTQDYTITKPLRDSETNAYVIGTFPTVVNEKSSYFLSLFREGEEEPFISELITDQVDIIRNQLIDITAIFKDGKIDCLIQLNNEWDGWNPGGNGSIQ